MIKIIPNFLSVNTVWVVVNLLKKNRFSPFSYEIKKFKIVEFANVHSFISYYINLKLKTQTLVQA